MNPWIDRNLLIQNTKKFVQQYGYFFRMNAKRISSLVEISVYNSLVQHYESQGFQVAGANLGPKKSFKYKLTSSGLAENYSHFTAEKNGKVFQIMHNVSIQSAHDAHLYFTADVVVVEKNGATTQTLKSGRRHSFVANGDLVTFAEVKHINPFPEVLFNFTGLVLEFMPGLIEKRYDIQDSGDRLCPIITFTGVASEHSEKIQDSLTNRYGFNISFGTSKTRGKLTGFASMKRYAEKQKIASVVPFPVPKRRIAI
jgi:hypothetical protein